MRWRSWSRSESHTIHNTVHSSITFAVSCRFEGEVYSDWTQSVDEVAKGNLEKPLLVRDQSNMMISVNFDPKVTKPHYLCVCSS